jgi:hypothetical protein
MSALRDLETLIVAQKLPSLFGPNSFPRADEVKDINVATDRAAFETFCTRMYVSFVESIDRAGSALGKKKYFFEDIKMTYPDLWDSLHRVRLYRNAAQHLFLEPKIGDAYLDYLEQDLDGRKPRDIVDAPFLLQQRVLDALLLGVQYELGRYS